jgi:hypothetical protein
LKKRILRFLRAVSGNDLSEMLKDVLDKRTMRSLQEKYLSALTNISNAVNDPKLVKIKSKHNFIRPLRLAGISLPDAREIGFECGKELWKSCLDINDRNLGGRSRKSDLFIDEVKHHMEELSNIGSNRSVRMPVYADRDPFVIFKKKKIFDTYENVRYRQTTLKEAYRKFIEPNNQLSTDLIRQNAKFSTFYKYIDNRFKKPFRLTDLCDYCESAKILEREVKKSLDSNEIKTEFNYKKKDFSPKTLLHCIKTNRKLRLRENQRFNYSQEMKLLIEKINVLNSVDYHKSTAERQRRAYNSQRNDLNLLKTSILIDIDFKQRIILGEGPRQLNSEFYQAEKKGVVCLGFGIYFIDKSTDFEFINCLNLDIISDHPGQTAYDLIRIFRFLMEQPLFKAIDKENYVIWTDCGSQFRSAEFIYFLFNELAEKEKAVNLNYFCEKHGNLRFIFCLQ